MIVIIMILLTIVIIMILLVMIPPPPPPEVRTTQYAEGEIVLSKHMHACPDLDDRVLVDSSASSRRRSTVPSVALNGKWSRAGAPRPRYS
jgi:hypothetical protein